MIEATAFEDKSIKGRELNPVVSTVGTIISMEKITIKKRVFIIFIPLVFVRVLVPQGSALKINHYQQNPLQ